MGWLPEIREMLETVSEPLAIWEIAQKLNQRVWTVEAELYSLQERGYLTAYPLPDTRGLTQVQADLSVRFGLNPHYVRALRQADRVRETSIT